MLLSVPHRGGRCQLAAGTWAITLHNPWVLSHQHWWPLVRWFLLSITYYVAIAIGYYCTRMYPHPTATAAARAVVALPAAAAALAPSSLLSQQPPSLPLPLPSQLQASFDQQLSRIIADCCQLYSKDVTWKLTHAQNVQQKLRPRYVPHDTRRIQRQLPTQARHIMRPYQ